MKPQLSSAEGACGLRVALLTNFIAPYRLPMFQELARRVDALRVMISTRMEANRSWEPDFGTLDVVVHRNLTVSFQWKHPSGFREKVYVHFPYNTLTQLIAFRPDVVISNEFGFRTLNALVYRLLFRRTRLVIWATLSESTEAGRWIVRRMFRHIAVRVADAIATNGKSGARYLAAFHVPPSKIFLVPQTADTACFAAVPLARNDEEAHRLLYVGRLIPLKAVVPFIKILAEWCRRNPQRNVEFWLAGDGPEEEAIRGMELPGNLRTKLLGNVPYADLPQVYRQTGALVLPTLADEWGLVINEALATGLPVLGSLYSQAVQELIQEGVNGWTYHIDRPEEVRARLQQFFDSDREQLKQMRTAARQTALRLTPEGVIDQMMNAVNRAVQEGRPSVANADTVGT